MCDACDNAQHQPLWGGFQANCLPCMARMLAHGPAFWQSRQAGKLTPEYRRALEAIFGTEHEQWHETVKEWSARIDQAKTEQKT